MSREIQLLLDRLFEEYEELNRDALQVILDGPCKISEKTLKRDLVIGSKKYGLGRMQEVSLITSACSNPKWTSVLEVGVGYGISTVSFAGALKRRESAHENPSAPKIVFQTVDFARCLIPGSRGQAPSRQTNIKNLQKLIKLKNWNHSDVGSNQWFREKLLNKKSAQKFNVAFIDGDHSYEQTRKDWNNLEKLLEEDFIVFFHDLMWRTQGLRYPNTARKAFEEISIEKYNKLILNTPFRVGVVYPKSNSSTEEWLTNILEDLHISIRETNPINCSEAEKHGW